MREFQQKKRIQRAIYSPLSLALLIILFLILVRATWGVYQKQSESAQKRDQTQQEYLALLEKKKNLEESVQKLSTTDGVEEEIREKYRMAKKGEQLLVLTDTQARVSETVDESFWQSFLKTIKEMFY